MLSWLICLHPAICCDAKFAEAASTPLEEIEKKLFDVIIIAVMSNI